MRTFQFNTNKWIRISLVNFFIVALIGLILRYKINFSLPFINQKFLLHGHSHFAFVGWVTLALMTLMVHYLIRSEVAARYKKYHWLLFANTLSSYGMLCTFIFQGYALLSIAFSTSSIFVSYIFIYCYWKDLNTIKHSTHITNWFKAALILWGLSSFGTFFLAYLMASHTLIQELYFASIYFFLHFQYNGWFLFSCFGLLFSVLKENQQIPFLRINKRLFIVLGTTVLPSYLLSLLGIKIPAFLYWTGALAAAVQLMALFYCYQLLQAMRKSLYTPLNNMTVCLWNLVYISFTVKVLLQALSIIPYFGTFAFSIRPVIIGYLHLCFLGLISFFILGYFNELLSRHGITLNKSGLLLFISGVIIQEVVLMVQALNTIMSQSSANAPIVLFITAMLIATGLSLLFNFKTVKDRQ